MLNSVYNGQNVLEQIKKEFLRNGFILLDDFFDKNFYYELNDQIKRLKFEKKEIFNRYSYYENSSHNFAKIFMDSGILELLNDLGFNMNNINISIRKFKHGSYTLLHDSELSKKGFELVFFISADWKEKFGGSIVYNRKEPLIVNPKKNRLFLIKRDSELDFVKYINNFAGGRSFFVIKCNAPTRI